MTPHETARYLRGESQAAARSTRAFYRGNVSDNHTDGRPIVLLPNGGKILAEPSQLFDTHAGQALHMVKQGVGYTAFAPSPYGGGNGAPFAPP